MVVKKAHNCFFRQVLEKNVNYVVTNSLQTSSLVGHFTRWYQIPTQYKSSK